jgi:outer membrane protein TolC
VVLALCGAALSACATLKPKPVPTVPPPVAEARPDAAAPEPAAPIVKIIPPPPKTSCVPKALAHAPKYPDTDAALKDAGGAADRYQLMAAGRLLRMRRLAELEKTVDACR